MSLLVVDLLSPGFVIVLLYFSLFIVSDFVPIKLKQNKPTGDVNAGRINQSDVRTVNGPNCDVTVLMLTAVN